MKQSHDWINPIGHKAKTLTNKKTHEADLQ